MKKWHKSLESKKKSYLEGKRRDKKTMLELMTVLSIGICLSVGVLLVAIWQVKFSKKMCYFWSKNIKISLLKLAIIPRFWPLTIFYLVNILAEIKIGYLILIKNYGFLRKMLFCIPVWSCLICSLDGWKSYNQFHRLVGLATFSIFIYSKPNII